MRDVARATETGAATNIIYGLALGYQSAILPVIILSAIIFLALTTAVRSYTLPPTPEGRESVCVCVRVRVCVCVCVCA